MVDPSSDTRPYSFDPIMVPFARDKGISAFFVSGQGIKPTVSCLIVHPTGPLSGTGLNFALVTVHPALHVGGEA